MKWRELNKIKRQGYLNSKMHAITWQVLMNYHKLVWDQKKCLLSHATYIQLIIKAKLMQKKVRVPNLVT